MDRRPTVNDVPPKDRDVAMVFQSYALYPHMTVEQNMGFALKLRGVALEERASRVREAAEILGLEELLHRRPAELSGGQRQGWPWGERLFEVPACFSLMNR